MKPNASIPFPGCDQGNEPTIPGMYAVIESFERIYEFDVEQCQNKVPYCMFSLIVST
jgi:hypothetical protein